MKANEFKVNCLVTIDNSDCWPELKDIPLEVTGINETVSIEGEPTYSISLRHINQIPNTYYEEYSQFIHYIKPIPLTEEWHKKFGGKKSVFNAYEYDISRFEKGILSLVFSGDYLYLRECDKPYNRPTDLICLWNKDLKKEFYVHEWQTIYLALTGEELTAQKTSAHSTEPPTESEPRTE